MLTNLKPQESMRKGIDYKEYNLSGSEYIIYCAEGLILFGIISYFFYRSIVAFFLMIPLLVVFLKTKQRELGKKRREELNVQFKDAVLAISANQKAGYSIENAFREAYKDMSMLYGKESHICKELNYIAKKFKSQLNLFDWLTVKI